jgi:hypothetical protein
MPSTGLPGAAAGSDEERVCDRRRVIRCATNQVVFRPVVAFNHDITKHQQQPAELSVWLRAATRRSQVLTGM